MLQPSLIDDGAERWVSVSDAARLEASAGRPINKSSISRFIDRNGDVPVRRDGGGRVVAVEYSALSRARASSLSVQDSRAFMPAPAPSPIASAPAPTSRKRELEERKLELDLGEREGELLDRTAMTMAIEAIAATLTQGMERRRRKLATDTVGLGGVREVELVIKASDRELMRTIINKLQDLAGGLVVEVDADDIETLAA